jgi:DeoR/GlpR family transcriptional regulator of sugar metabolism
MLAEQRRQEILRMLRAEGALAAASVAERLGVSPATVRRDISLLDRDGRLQRVHGGALLGEATEPSFADVAVTHPESKDRIARQAAALVPDGAVVLCDIGTSVHRVVVHLHGRRLTVVTSNLAVYEELIDDEDVELVLLGGQVRRNYRSMVGFLTEEALTQVNADLLFLGTSGVRADGSVMDTTTIEVPVKRAMLRAADRTVLVADRSKFPGTGLARVCGPESLHTVVTDSDADPATLKSFRDAGVEVIAG